jgi:hypothetical protein
LQLEECGFTSRKKNSQLIQIVFNNMHSPYQVFVSNHCTTKDLFDSIGPKDFNTFCNALIEEQGKLRNLGMLGSEQKAHVPLKRSIPYIISEVPKIIIP